METEDTGMTDATETEMEADATECIGEVLTREAVHDRWAETSEDRSIDQEWTCLSHRSEEAIMPQDHQLTATQETEQRRTCTNFLYEPKRPHNLVLNASGASYFLEMQIS